MKVKRKAAHKGVETPLAREVRLDHDVSDRPKIRDGEGGRESREDRTRDTKVKIGEIVSVIKFDLSTRLVTRAKEFSK